MMRRLLEIRRKRLLLLRVRVRVDRLKLLKLKSEIVRPWEARRVMAPEPSFTIASLLHFPNLRRMTIVTVRK